MSEDKQTDSQGNAPPGANQNNLKEVYKELCTTYRAIDDFRMKLLGFLPLATGTGIFLLKDIVKSDAQQFLLPIGLFGFFITLGLFLYEIYGLKKCHALIKVGQQIESALSIDGQFIRRPREVGHLFNETAAASIVYPTVLAAWIFLACISYSESQKADLSVAVPVAVFVLIIACFITFGYEWKLRQDDSIEVEREDTKVLYIESSKGRERSREALDTLQSRLPSSCGRKFYGTFLYPNGSYQACVALEATDDLDTLGLDIMIIPGGRYVRRTLQNPKKCTRKILNAFTKLSKEYQDSFDPSRPCIEFHKSKKEFLLFIPIRQGITNVA